MTEPVPPTEQRPPFDQAAFMRQSAKRRLESGKHYVIDDPGDEETYPTFEYCTKEARLKRCVLCRMAAAEEPLPDNVGELYSIVSSEWPNQEALIGTLSGTQDIIEQETDGIEGEITVTIGRVWMLKEHAEKLPEWDGP
jgi:hypothetical protein